MRLHHAGGLLLAVAAVAWLGVSLLSQPTRSSRAADCQISDKLVNSCRAWLGATAQNYPQAAGDTKSQLLYHESADHIGRQLDIVHTYHPVNDNNLSATDLYFATRDQTYLFANWKPASKWADVSTGARDAAIDQMAASVRSISPKKIFITLNHEPENDVTSGGTCSAYVGSAGTTDDYKAMWRYVENRFTSDGTTNVVWVMDYMNYAPWDCVVQQLYPGDDLVDWIMFNAYGNGKSATDFSQKVNHFYNLLTTNSNAQHNYLSKPWGIVEWGVQNATSAQITSYFTQAKAALDNNSFPNLHAYMIFDERDKGSATGSDFRVAYDENGNISSTQMAAYRAFATDSHISDTSGGGGGGGGGGGTPTPPPPPPPSPPPDTVPPTATITAPASGATVSGNFEVDVTASDNVRVGSVTLRVDDHYVATDSTAPYTFTLNAADYSDGAHTIVARAWDGAGNVGESNTITLNINSHQPTNNPPPAPTGPGATPPIPGNQNPVIISAGTPSSPNNPIPVSSGSIIISPSAPGNSVRVWVDNKPQGSNVVDTTNLPNGTHVLTIDDGGQLTKKYIKVANPFAIATINSIRSHGVLYISVCSTIIVVLVAWVGRSYIFGLTGWRERSIVRRQRSIH